MSVGDFLYLDWLYRNYPTDDEFYEIVYQHIVENR